MRRDMLCLCMEYQGYAAEDCNGLGLERCTVQIVQTDGQSTLYNSFSSLLSLDYMEYLYLTQLFAEYLSLLSNIARCTLLYAISVM